MFTGHNLLRFTAEEAWDGVFVKEAANRADSAGTRVGRGRARSRNGSPNAAPRPGSVVSGGPPSVPRAAGFGGSPGSWLDMGCGPGIFADDVGHPKVGKAAPR